MQLTLDRNALLEKLEMLQNIANTRTTMPILNNILIEAHEAEEAIEGPADITLTANNIEIALSANLPALVIESGITTIPCKKFYELVREVPAGSSIEFSVDENNYIELKYENGSYKVKGLDPEEFPAQPDISEVEFTLSGVAFNDLLSKTLFAASLEEVRYFLNAIFFSFMKEKTVAVATDGRRLALTPTDAILGENQEAQSFILPLKTAREALRIFAGSQSISCARSHGQIAFTDGDAVLTARLIEGEYPDYNKITSMPAPNEIFINKDALVSAIKRVSLLADPSNYSISINIGSKALKLEVETPDLGAANEEVLLKEDFNGEETPFKFDARLLLQGLEQIKTENVKYCFGNTNELVFLYPANDEKYFNLLMPLRIEDVENTDTEEDTEEEVDEAAA